jgi:hypothetical protein
MRTSSPLATRPLVAGLLLALLGVLAVPAPHSAAQGSASLRLNFFSTRRELFGQFWGSGQWVAFNIDEDEQDLNKDGDTDDTLISLLNMRSLAVTELPLAIDTTLADESEDSVVAFSPKGDFLAIQVAESEQGGKDRNGNNAATENVLALYTFATRQITNLGVSGKNPLFAGDKLYFLQPEAPGRDLNGDGDTTDTVLCSYTPATRKTANLQVAGSRLLTAGDWLAVLVEEAAQGGADLNGDGDKTDAVVQLFRLSTNQWTNTRLEGSGGFVLTPNLLAVGVAEEKQGRLDLNGDKDLEDTVCAVWDLNGTGTPFNTAQDCAEGLAADGTLVGIVTTESAQGNTDLNKDGDQDDAVAQCYTLGAAKVVNIGRDATGGMVVNRGKVAFSCSEEDNGAKDLNGDGDTEDFVVLAYDPAKGPNGTVTNTKLAADGDLAAGDGFLAWKLLESDQGNRDLNRDGDTDDSVLAAMDLSTNAATPSSVAAADSLFVSSAGVAFSTFEADQGERDLNMDGDTDDEILQVARFVK